MQNCTQLKAMLTIFFILAKLDALCAACGGKVEHTFLVSQVNITHLCKNTLAILVNGQFPGPTIEVEEGDSVAVHVVNASPHAITIHWHGVKQRMNCWADGAGMVTQCPIQPNTNFTYRFDVAGQEGTLWWHAHVSSLRATVHGALIIRPRSSSSYPFAKPDREIPIIIGEWWEIDLVQLDRRVNGGYFFDFPSAATINGKLGDRYNRSGSTMEDNYVLDVEHGNTYLLRITNAALFAEYYLKVAGHTFTVVAVDANYVKPYNTCVIAIAPGETVDALMVADAPLGRYYMVAKTNQAPEPDVQTPVFMARGVVQYNNISPSTSLIHSPKMPDQHDTITSFYFHGNLTSLPSLRLPPLMTHVDERLYIVLALGSMCKPRNGSSSSCNIHHDSFEVATMNNISFQLPLTMPLLEAHYYKSMTGGETLEELPDRPGRMYNFTDTSMLWLTTPTSRATLVRRFRYNTVVDVVFQSGALGASDSNPMHLHGHDMFVLAQGFGNYEPARDMKRYNLVDPPLRNTVLVPRLGWTAIRFVTDNPGVWFMHCHYGFHMSMGMAAAFVVEDGPSFNTSLPAPPADLPRCGQHSSRVAYG